MSLTTPVEAHFVAQGRLGGSQPLPVARLAGPPADRVTCLFGFCCSLDLNCAAHKWGVGKCRVWQLQDKFKLRVTGNFVTPGNRTTLPRIII